jgi:DNA repair protein RadC
MSIPEAPVYTLIRDLPATERPRERLRDAGSQALSNAELLAIMLRVGSASESALSQATRLLGRFGGLPGIWRASFTELCNEKGLGEAKAAQLKAALGGHAPASASPEARPTVRSPDLAELMLTEMSLFDQEHVRIALLDVRNHVVSTRRCTSAARTPQVRIADLLSDAIRDKATSIVLIHNHPSGDPTPSSADGMMTRQLFDAAKLMDIALLDHLVIGGGRYVSMRAMNLGSQREPGPVTPKVRLIALDPTARC